VIGADSGVSLPRVAKILIVDDLESVLVLYATLLSGHTCSTAKTVDTAKDVLSKEVFDIVILDLRIGNFGTESGSSLIDQVSPVRWVVASANLKRYVIAECLLRGVHGIYDKRNHPDCLKQAVATVLAGGRYYSPIIIEDMGEIIRQHFVHPFTDQENKILVSLASGLTGKEIALKLHVHDSAVSRSLQRMKTFLGNAGADNAWLLHQARDTGLLSVAAMRNKNETPGSLL
jgi:DNA-binding NarL/FixJ family response regulator